MADEEMKQNIEAAVATQNSEAANAKSALSPTAAIAQALSEPEFVAAVVAGGAASTQLTNNPPQANPDYFHHILAKTIAELKTVALFTEAEVAHIEAVFKKHI